MAGITGFASFELDEVREALLVLELMRAVEKWALRARPGIVVWPLSNPMKDNQRGK